MFDNDRRPNELECRLKCFTAKTFRLFIAVIAITVVTITASTCNAAKGTDANDSDTNSSLGQFDPLDDAPETLVPETTRSWDEKALLESLAHYTTGRSAERREVYPVALRHYQRAFLFNPGSKDAARAAVAIAFKLKRNHEALRWAVQTARIDLETSVTLLKHLALFQIETQEYGGAAEFYLRAFEVIPETNQVTAADLRLLLDAARLFLIDGQNEKSADCFIRVLDLLKQPERLDGITRDIEREELFNDPALSMRLMAEAMLDIDRTADAQRALAKLKPLIADASFTAYIQAKIDLKRGKKAAALRQITSALSNPSETLDEDRSEPYELYAQLLEAAGQSKQILPKLQATFKKNPNNGPAGYALAQRIYDEGRLEDAASLYRRLLRDTPSAMAYKQLVTIYIETRSPKLLEILGEIIDKTGALQAVESQIETIASDAKLLDILSEAYRKAAANPKPRNTGPAIALGLVLLEAERVEDAADPFEAAVKLDPEKAQAVYRLWGGTLLLAEHASEAADVFRREVETITAEDSDQKAAALYMLTTALAMADKHDEALKTAEQTADLDPEDVELQARIAWVLMLADRTDEAIERFEKIIEKLEGEIDIESRTILRSVRLTLARLYARGENDQASQETMLQILDEYPGDVEVSNDLGYYWADENRHLTVSLRLIDRAVEAEPENAAYRDSLGWVYYRLGRLNEARVELERAVKLSEKEERLSGEIFEHLGDVNAALDHRRQALDFYRRAESAYTDEELPDEAARVAKKRSEFATENETTNQRASVQ